MVFENAGIVKNSGFEFIAEGTRFELGKHSTAKDVFMS